MIGKPLTEAAVERLRNLLRGFGMSDRQADILIDRWLAEG